jgi:hypothetical protein
MRRDGDGRAARRPGRHGGGPGDVASDHGGQDVRCRGGGREGQDGGQAARGGRAAGVRGETALSGRRRAVPTALLTRGPSTARSV